MTSRSMLSYRSVLGIMLSVILLMEEILHHQGCLKPCKSWDNLPISTGAGFLPSIVCSIFGHDVYRTTWESLITRQVVPPVAPQPLSPSPPALYLGRKKSAPAAPMELSLWWVLEVRCWNWSFEIGWNWLFPVFFDQLPMFSQKHGLVIVLSTTKLWPVGTYTLMPASTVWIPCWSTHADWGYFKHYNLSLQDVFEIYWSNENRVPGSLGYVGDYTTYIYYIPSYLGIIS